MKKRRKIKLYVYAFLTVFVMAAIFYLSEQDADVSSDLSESFLNTAVGRFLGKVLPILTSEGLQHDIRKYAHVFEFFCLGAVSALFYAELISNKNKSSLLSSGFSLAYAVSDEWHQTFVPGRSGQISDVCIDFTGIALGVLAVPLICVFQKKKTGSV